MIKKVITIITIKSGMCKMTSLYFILTTALLVAAILRRYTRREGWLSKLVEFVADLTFFVLCIYTFIIWVDIL